MNDHQTERVMWALENISAQLSTVAAHLGRLASTVQPHAPLSANTTDQSTGYIRTGDIVADMAVALGAEL